MINLTTCLFVAVLLGPGLIVPTAAQEIKAIDNQVRPAEALSVENYLDQQIVRIIVSTKRINVYNIKAFTTDVNNKGKKKKYFAEYEVLAVRKANKKQTSALKSALLEGPNYVTDYTNKCSFTATIGLELISKSGKLNVVISYRCEKLLFLRRNTEIYKEVKSLERFDLLVNEIFKRTPTLNDVHRPRGTVIDASAGNRRESQTPCQ